MQVYGEDVDILLRIGDAATRLGLNVPPSSGGTSGGSCGWSAPSEGSVACLSPRFHSRHSGRSSFRLTGAVKVEGGSVTLPRIGRVKLKERGYLPVVTRLRSVAVSER